jgi:hypothetical protein
MSRIYRKNGGNRDANHMHYASQAHKAITTHGCSEQRDGNQLKQARNRYQKSWNGSKIVRNGGKDGEQQGSTRKHRQIVEQSVGKVCFATALMRRCVSNWRVKVS